MRVSALARAVGIAALTTLTVPIMGAGPECPTPCFVAYTDCAPNCGDAVTEGTCNANLVCIRDNEGGDGEGAASGVPDSVSASEAGE